MIGTAINKDTKFQKFINDCQFPPPPPGKRQAESKTESSNDTSSKWKHTVRKEIIQYIQENMSYYAAAICKANGGIANGGQLAVCIFLENNTQFASESLLSQYDYNRYLDTKGNPEPEKPAFASKGFALYLPEAVGYNDSIDSKADYAALLSLLEELELEDPADTYEELLSETPAKSLRINRKSSPATPQSPTDDIVNNDATNSEKHTI